MDKRKEIEKLGDLGDFCDALSLEIREAGDPLLSWVKVSTDGSIAHVTLSPKHLREIACDLNQLADLMEQP